jgi:hypothetical protein
MSLCQVEDDHRRGDSLLQVIFSLRIPVEDERGKLAKPKEISDASFDQDYKRFGDSRTKGTGRWLVEREELKIGKKW